MKTLRRSKLPNPKKKRVPTKSSALKRSVLVAACSLVAALAVLVAINPYDSGFGVRINRSESLPQKIFLSRPITFPPQVGDIVTFTHPSNRMPLAKGVVGVAGDVIRVGNNHIFVAGVDRGEIQLFTPSGRLLEPIAETVIPDGYIFAWAPHPLSHDSRYDDFGLILVTDLEEKLWAVF